MLKQRIRIGLIQSLPNCCLAAVMHIGTEQTARGAHTCCRRYDNGSDIELLRDRHGKSPAGTTVGNQTEFARIEPAGDTANAHRLSHAVHRDFENTRGGLFNGQPQRLRNVSANGRFCQLRLNLQTRLTQRVVPVPPHRDQCVRHRGALPAPAIAGRARISASTVWPYSEHTACIDPSDRPAAGTNGPDVAHRHHRVVACNLIIKQVLHAELSLRGNADISGRTTHV